MCEKLSVKFWMKSLKMRVVFVVIDGHKLAYSLGKCDCKISLVTSKYSDYVALCESIYKFELSFIHSFILSVHTF